MVPLKSYRLHLLLCAFLCVTPGCFDGQLSSSSNSTSQKKFADKGVREANASISKGKLILKEYPPLPYPAGHNEYVQLLQSKCGVTWECLPSDHPGRPADIRAEVQAWNETMEAEIRKRFGEHIFSELRAQVKAGQQAPQGGNNPTVVK